jgi:membrane-bound lytic murein transglycosylase C
MKKITTLSIIFSFILLNALSYEEYYQQQMSDYNSYEKNLDSEFKTFQKIYFEEFNKFKKELGLVWKEPKISTKTEWIEYSPDLKSRKIIDFDKNKIEIEVILDKKTDSKQAEKKLSLELAKTLLETENQAEEKDILAQRVKRKTDKMSSVKTDKSQKPQLLVIGSEVLGKSEPTVQDAVSYVKKAIQSNTISKANGKQHNTHVFKVKIDLPRNFPYKKARRYKSEVHKNSSKWKISPALIFAIMHSESAFNPRARSHIPAYGLMQLVPTSGGADAYRYVFKQRKIPSASYLYNPSNNINLGTAYLRLLDTAYLKEIKNPESRLYCVISAYNTGAGNVFRAFHKPRKNRKRVALQKINNMSPKQVYNHLIRNLPYDETKNYLKKVSTRMKYYENAKI